jgi:uncharacterized membrane protein YsdA (DUF1294 family)
MCKRATKDTRRREQNYEKGRIHSQLQFLVFGASDSHCLDSGESVPRHCSMFIGAIYGRSHRLPEKSSRRTCKNRLCLPVLLFGKVGVTALKTTLTVMTRTKSTRPLWRGQPFAYLSLILSDRPSYPDGIPQHSDRATCSHQIPSPCRAGSGGH